MKKVFFLMTAHFSQILQAKGENGMWPLCVVTSI